MRDLSSPPFPSASRCTAACLAAGAGIVSALYLSSLYSYLLFHSIIEIFTVAIACGIFMIAWNSRRLLANNYLLFIGIAYLFVGIIDLVHALSYKNMGVFSGIDANVPTQLWIAARYLQALSLLAAPLFLRRKLRPGMVVAAYVIVVFFLVGSIFSWGLFPDCFIEGAGLTTFKKGSEYVICLLLLCSLIFLLRRREFFDRGILHLLAASIVLTIFAELAFTFYVSVFGLSNMVGHFAKGGAFFLIYKALIETGLTRPYALLFRELKESEERYRYLYNETPVMLHSIDADGRLLNVCNYWLAYLGYAREEVLGRKMAEFFTPESRKRAEEQSIPEFFSVGKVTDIPFEVVKKSGEKIDVLLTAIAERDTAGKVSRSLTVMVDVTERKKAAETIQALNEDLEERNVELEASNCELQVALADLEAANAELETSNSSLAEANQELEAFNHTISHDLRSPLNGITGFCELLLAERERLAEDQLMYLQHIHESARRMDQMTRTLLDFSRIARCELQRSEINLSEKAKAVAAELQLRDPSRRATFTIEEALTAEADASLLRIVLENLLGNAWKYTGKRETAEIRFGRTERRGISVYYVSDNGHGFPMDDAQNLFRPFHRLSHTSGFPGHGIGLATVQRIILRHGGRVWGEGEPGKGATFYFTL